MNTNQCIFCDIARKKIPADIVYEDNNFLAFMDINPQSPGHVQIIPKKHFRWVWDLPSRDTSTKHDAPPYEDYFIVVKKVARATQGTFGTDAVWMKVMGDEVPHAHIWLFPAPYEADGDKKDFAGNAEKIRQALAEKNDIFP